MNKEKTGTKSKKKPEQGEKEREKETGKEAKGEKKEIKEKETKKEEKGIKEMEEKKIHAKKFEKKERKGEKKSKEVIAIQKKIRMKWKPCFRGRFGRKWLHKPSIKKWNKWRKPRGIDIKRTKEDGAIPKTGYRTAKSIRFFHPSGMKEITVRNANELNEGKKNFAVRIARRVGGKKRAEIARKAKELGVKLVN